MRINIYSASMQVHQRWIFCNTKQQYYTRQSVLGKDAELLADHETYNHLKKQTNKKNTLFLSLGVLLQGFLFVLFWYFCLFVFHRETLFYLENQTRIFKIRFHEKLTEIKCNSITFQDSEGASIKVLGFTNNIVKDGRIVILNITHLHY